MCPLKYVMQPSFFLKRQFALVMWVTPVGNVSADEAGAWNGLSRRGEEKDQTPLTQPSSSSQNPSLIRLLVPLAVTLLFLVGRIDLAKQFLRLHHSNHTRLEIRRSEFLAWLHGRPGYCRRIDPSHISYLNLTTNDERVARATSPKSYATVEQYRAALLAMPTGNEVERRDQALLALLLLTAMRDTAVVGLKLKHISVERSHVFQDPREIKTKFRKAIETTFLPVGEDITAIVRRKPGQEGILNQRKALWAQ